MPSGLGWGFGGSMKALPTRLVMSDDGEKRGGGGKMLSGEPGECKWLCFAVACLGLSNGWWV